MACECSAGDVRNVAAHVGFTGLRRTEEPLPAIENAEAGWWTVTFWRAFTWVRVHPWMTASILVVVVGLLWYWRRRTRRGTV